MIRRHANFSAAEAQSYFNSISQQAPAAEVGQLSEKLLDRLFLSV